MLPLHVAFLDCFCIPFYVWSYLQNSGYSQTCQISLIKSSFYSGDGIKPCAPNTDSHLCRELDLKMLFRGLAPPCLNLMTIAELLFCVCQNGAEREVVIHYSWQSLCDSSSKFSARHAGTWILPVVTDRSPSTGKTAES